MHSPQILLALAPLLAYAQSDSSTWVGDATTGYYSETFATSIPVTDVLTGFYGTAIPTGATGAVATSLASALYSKETAVAQDDGYRSAAFDLYEIVATQSDADAIFSSLDNAGFARGDFTTAAWYTEVPASAQSEVASLISEYQAVEASILGAGVAATTTTSGVTSTTSTTSTGSAGGSSTGTTSATATSTAGAPGARVTGGAVAGLAAVVAFGAALL